MTDRPITPPPELLQQWATEYWGNPGESIGNGEKYIATQAARWGADQELEACCEWLSVELATYLRDRRRPGQLSLKEQALAVLDDASDRLNAAHENILRRALEQLDD